MILVAVKTEEDLEEALISALAENRQVRRARSFDAAGLMTSERGVVLGLRNGAEFQITIVRSKAPRE